MKTTLTAVAALMMLAAPVAAESTAPITFVPEQSQSEVLGTDFIGTQVVSKDKQPLGKIANLVFDQTGRIELAVISIGGFLGIGNKEVAVPFTVLTSEEVNKKHVFSVDLTKDQLKAAVAFKTLNDQARSELYSKWRAKAEQAWAEIKAKTGQTYEEAKEKAGHAYQEAKDKAGQAYQDAKQDVNQAREKIEEKTEPKAAEPKAQ